MCPPKKLVRDGIYNIRIKDGATIIGTLGTKAALPNAYVYVANGEGADVFRRWEVKNIGDDNLVQIKLDHGGLPLSVASTAEFSQVVIGANYDEWRLVKKDGKILIQNVEDEEEKLTKVGSGPNFNPANIEHALDSKNQL